MKQHFIRESRLNRLVSFNPITNKAIVWTNFYGLVASKSFLFSEPHFATLMRVLKFHYKRKRKAGLLFSLSMLFNVFLTKKAIGVRMGKGKGGVSEKVCYIRPGTLLLSLNDDNPVRAGYVLRKCIRRIPVACKIISSVNW